MSALTAPPGRAEFDRQLCDLLPDMRGYSMRLTRSQQEADDLVSRTMVKLLNSWRQFQTGTNFKAWAFCCMRNERINEFRRLKRAPASYDQQPILVAAAIQDGSQEDDLAVTRIHAALKTMRDDHRQVLEAICFNEQSYEDTAAALGLTVGTVKSRLWRARTALQQAIDGDSNLALSEAQREWMGQAGPDGIIYCPEGGLMRGAYLRVMRGLQRRGLVIPAGVDRYRVSSAGREAGRAKVELAPS